MSDYTSLIERLRERARGFAVEAALHSGSETHALAMIAAQHDELLSEAADALAAQSAELADAYWLLAKVGQPSTGSADYDRALTIFRRARAADAPSTQGDVK